MINNIVFPDFNYSVSTAIPSAATYRHVRTSAGMSDKTPRACAIGLPRSIFCIQILADPIAASGPTGDAAGGMILEPGPVSFGEGEDKPDPRCVGMGRLIGDGGCHLQVVDISVLPSHQKRGLGKLIMQHLMAWIHENVPPSCYVSLIADGEAKRLYKLFGFEETSEGGSVGMRAWVGRREGGKWIEE